MRLATLVPDISQELVEALGGCGIHTDIELVFSPPVEILKRLPDGAATLQQIIDTIDTIRRLNSAPGKSALDLLEEEKRRKQTDPVILTGLEELDRLVDDRSGVDEDETSVQVGFGGGRVIQLAGDHRVGKTAFTQYLIIRYLITSHYDGALWIDTTGDFSPEIIAHLLRSPNLAFNGSIEAVLERLQVCFAFDVGTVFDVLEELSSNFDLAMVQTRCIVIDSIAPLLGPSLSAESSQGHAQMINLMRHLRSISRTHGIAVFVVNSATLVRPGDVAPPAVVATNKKPSLGPSFAYLVDATLWMGRGNPQADIMEDDETTVHTIEVLTSRHSVTI
ncbi:hypothetical protein AX16_001932 [Volvariella volvacea WC 439]|nr:hypothetical protein AX16_001932 [Volvariella volvacea WC 439]